MKNTSLHAIGQQNSNSTTSPAATLVAVGTTAASSGSGMARQKDTEVYQKGLAICHQVWDGGKMAAKFPGYAVEDLCHETFLAMKRCGKDSPEKHWGFFRKVAGNKLIDLYRRGRTRSKHCQEVLMEDAAEVEESRADKIQLFVCRARQKALEEETTMSGRLQWLGKIPVKPRLQPILNAVVQEALTGEPFPTTDLARKMGGSESNIRHMRRQVQELLQQALAKAYPMEYGRYLKPKAAKMRKAASPEPNQGLPQGPDYLAS